MQNYPNISAGTREKDIEMASFSPTAEEKQKYILKTEQDYEILGKIKQLEKKKLSSDDKKLIAFLRTQLEQDWRTPMIKRLDELLKKY